MSPQYLTYKSTKPSPALSTRLKAFILADSTVTYAMAAVCGLIFGAAICIKL